jgi:hypothetical protein
MGSNFFSPSKFKKNYMNKLLIPFFRSKRINVSILAGTFIGVIFLGNFTSCNRDKDDQQPIPVISSFSPTSGLPAKDDISGTTIRINGENFSKDISANELQLKHKVAKANQVSALRNNSI